ncbi:hypothetical protein, partial [Paenibacillus sp. MDMC362]|uniref:hypothetical protein n=1 Tax=Paenibacillus sp. MDMC362 TaxID=2977365 RepID=UPI001C656F0F
QLLRYRRISFAPATLIIYHTLNYLASFFLKTFISLKAAIYARSEAARNNISQHSYVSQLFFENQ